MKPQVTALTLTSSSRVEMESLSFAVDWKSYPEQFDKRHRNQEGSSRSRLFADVALDVGTAPSKSPRPKFCCSAGHHKQCAETGSIFSTAGGVAEKPRKRKICLPKAILCYRNRGTHEKMERHTGLWFGRLAIVKTSVLAVYVNLAHARVTG